jgi:hypothetical protein
MRKIVYVLTALAFLLLFVVECRHKEEGTVEVQKFDRDSFIANNKTIHAADSMHRVVIQSEAERLKTITSIKFDKEVYDFGECTEGDKIKKTIEFTNTGKLPLVINQAFGSCGCTIPTYDKEPVAPGQKGKIEVEFNSTGKPGANTKSVMVEANTNPPVTTVSFSVKVNSAKKKGWFN